MSCFQYTEDNYLCVFFSETDCVFRSPIPGISWIHTHNQWRILALCRESYNLLRLRPEAAKATMSALPMPPKKRPHSVRTLPREQCSRVRSPKPLPTCRQDQPSAQSASIHLVRAIHVESEIVSMSV